MADERNEPTEEELRPYMRPEAQVMFDDPQTPPQTKARIRQGARKGWAKAHPKNAEPPSTPPERFIEFHRNAQDRVEMRLHPPPESDEDRRLRKREELLRREERLQAEKRLEQHKRELENILNPSRPGDAQGAVTHSALRDEADRAGRHKHETTQAEKWLLVLTGLGDVLLAMIGGNQTKLWISLVMLVVACAIQVAVVMKVQPFKSLKLNMMLAMAVVVVLTFLWWGSRPEPPVIADQETPKSVVHDPVIQVTRIHVSTNTKLPFQPGQPIGINFVLGVTGAPENVHFHARARFVPTLVAAEREKLTD